MQLSPEETAGRSGIRRAPLLVLPTLALAILTAPPLQAQSVIAGTSLAGDQYTTGYFPVGFNGQTFAFSFQVAAGGAWLVQDLQVLVTYDPNSPSQDATFYIGGDASGIFSALSSSPNLDRLVSGKFTNEQLGVARCFNFENTCRRGRRDKLVPRSCHI